MVFVVFGVTAFLLGSIPTAYLAAKWAKGVDIRRYGSGNVGATNALRVVGKGAGILVLLVDFLKGFAPVFMAPFILEGSAVSKDWIPWFGFFPILGHIFSPFMGFKGGKGIATGSGVLCALYPILFLGVLVVWAAVFAGTRIVSVSSMVSVVTLAALGFFFRLPWQSRLFFMGVVGLTLWTHRENIKRLLKGEEHRFVSR
ncbi:MAG: glycerol-3-phosphate 1-O-acyltransferase PlsY [Candidatus Omnitrophica bacterium]|nr:glycerol-3-phosphate 1-O-acyltransferase PlsY [Candidatus Omnitrophota bacterium]